MSQLMSDHDLNNLTGLALVHIIYPRTGRGSPCGSRPTPPVTASEPLTLSVDPTRRYFFDPGATL
jgi:hypothetical protein